VIFFNIGWPLTVLPWILALRRRTVVLYRTAYHASWNGSRLDPFRHRIQLRAAGLSHRLLPYSHFEKGQIIADGGVPPAKITPVYPGTSVPSATEAELGMFRASQGLEGKAVICHVARLSEFKGTDRLIRVLPQARQRTGQDVVLLLVGRNLEADSLSRLAGELGVTEHVRFTGPLPERELHLAYAASDVFALPSRYESFGFVFLEAMAHGVPVIGVRTGGVPEVIRDGETGFILESPDDERGLTDCLVRLLEDRALRMVFGARGLAWVNKQFTWPAAVTAVKSIVDEEQAKRCRS
jgi:phosphatidyl-myo-inositol dimannoside synthase